MKVIMREKKETHKHVTQHKHPAHSAHHAQQSHHPAQHPHAQHQHPHPQHQHTPAHHNQKLQAPQRHAAHQAEKAKHMKQESVFRCSGCGVKLHPMFRFCPNCGHKLK
ncbi:hypothetical protein KY362_06965, partial [Candidatus Woesearchaeota archaeon]|nr:hypothetical protein [Candidatus Woesearchaeota archaeon]